MTGRNKRLNAAAEVDRAGECLEEARALLSAGLPYGVASRAYYAVFHGARALLFSVGLEPKSHRAAVSMLGEHFIKRGLLSAAMGRLVARMQRDREDADYMTGAVFSLDQGRDLVTQAEQFLHEARRLLSGR